MQKFKNIVFVIISTLVLANCGGGGGGGSEPAPVPAPTPAPTPAPLTLSYEAPESLSDYQKFEFEVQVNNLQEGETFTLEVNHGDGKKIQHLDIVDNKILGRAPFVYTAEDLIFEISATSSNSRSASETVSIPVEYYRKELVGQSMNESPGLRGFTNIDEVLQTEKFAQWDFPAAVYDVRTLWNGRYCYPTPDNCYEGNDSSIGLASPNFSYGDFNGDGHEDVVVASYHVPRHLETIDAPDILVLLNDGHGRLAEDQTIFTSGVRPELSIPYRIEVRDFNGDGVDDIIVQNFATASDPESGYSYKWAPHLLLLSSDGKLNDASSNFDYSEDNAKTDFSHDASSGDVDGDGDFDFYAGSRLFLNDGNGNFAHTTSNVLIEMSYEKGVPMASDIVDINNDGFGDVISYWFDGPDGGYGTILMSDGTADLSRWTKHDLPVGPYGEGSKLNDASHGDFNGDGLVDLAIGVTRADPYYHGRYLQILFNEGDGNFKDVSSTNINKQLADFTEGDDPVGGGEGNIYVRDYDGDGDLDIFNNWQPNWSKYDADEVPPGILFFLNDGEGYFTSLEIEDFPGSIAEDTIQGYESDTNPPLSRGVPVNLDGEFPLDFVTGAPLSVSDVHDGSAFFFWAVISKKIDAQ